SGGGAYFKTVYHFNGDGAATYRDTPKGVNFPVFLLGGDLYCQRHSRSWVLEDAVGQGNALLFDHIHGVAELGIVLRQSQKSAYESQVAAAVVIVAAIGGDKTKVNTLQRSCEKLICGTAQSGHTGGAGAGSPHHFWTYNFKYADIHPKKPPKI